MFKIEVKFKAGNKEVPPDKFILVTYHGYQRACYCWNSSCRNKHLVK